MGADRLTAVPLGAALAPWLDAFDAPQGVGRVIVGCSGGTDSLALLALAIGARLDPVAAHVDHGLRPGSAGEADHVRAAAAHLGAPAVALTVQVAPGPGLEARAREARLGALERERAARGADAVLLGHTADDQAETVLLNVLRGAATAGLAGMPPRRARLAHPLLRLRRADTAEICARLRLRPLRDPMNDDPAFRRVWLRREVIPFLEAGTGRDLREILARQAAVLHEESALLDRLAGTELEAAGAWPGAPQLSAGALVGLDRALARRVVRLWLGPPPPSLAEVERVLGVAAGDRVAVELAGGRRVERSGGVLHRVDASTALRPFTVAVPGSAEAHGVSVETWVERAAPVSWPDGKWACVLDADRAGNEVVVRPGGGGRPQLATTAGATLWHVGYRVAAHARVTPGTRRYLWARVETAGEGTPA